MTAGRARGDEAGWKAFRYCPPRSESHERGEVAVAPVALAPVVVAPCVGTPGWAAARAPGFRPALAAFSHVPWSREVRPFVCSAHVQIEPIMADVDDALEKLVAAATANQMVRCARTAHPRTPWMWSRPLVSCASR